jgi:hypothetical protein
MPPPRSAMDKATVELHESIDENIRRFGRGYLSPEGESVTADLMGSARMVRWQEKKAAATFLGSFCWSEKSPVYGAAAAGSRSRHAGKRSRGERQSSPTGDGGGSPLRRAPPGDHVVVARSICNRQGPLDGSRSGWEFDARRRRWDRQAPRSRHRPHRIVMVEIFAIRTRAFDPRRWSRWPRGPEAMPWAPLTSTTPS